MIEGDRGPAGNGWFASVRVEEEIPLAEEIRVRSSLGSDEASVSISDLLGLRRAFWRRRVPPPPIPEERRERMESGRSVHSRLIAALPGEGAFEVRVRRAGIAGRIDLLADVPIEVKTGVAVGAGRLVDLRPDHVEQIAMYCALTGRTEGRIVTLTPATGEALAVEAVDVAVPEPGSIEGAMQGRARALREALGAGRPNELPACRWYGRRCEFQEAGVCDCSGAEPPPSGDILDRIGEQRPRRDIEERWRRALGALLPPSEPYPLGRFRDMIYPRRAYFERGPPPDPEVAVPLATPRPPGTDLYGRLIGAVEGGPVGEVARIPPRGTGPEEEVVGFRGVPFVVRTSRAWRRLRPEEAVDRFPQYALELGFRCAATGTTDGRVFLGFERAEKETDRYQVLRYRFEPMGPFASLRDARAEQFRAALAAGRPGDLPGCPGWMYDDCPYRTSCGCGGAAGRSQR